MNENELLIIEGESTGERHPINPDIFKLRGKPMKSWDNIVPKEPLSIPKFKYVTLEMPSHIDVMIFQFLSQYGDQLIKEGYAYEDNRRNKNSNK
jgi:hypothetical protein